MTLDLATLDQIDVWIAELQHEANKAQWQFPYKFGVGQGLLSIQMKMDNYRKLQRNIK